MAASPTIGRGLICELDILMLREGEPGQALHDVDNRLKTLFDALRKAHGPEELGVRTPEGQRVPGNGENPFYTVLEDDKLITHIGVTTDTLLEPVPDVPPEHAVRLVLNVTIRPYHVNIDTVDYV